MRKRVNDQEYTVFVQIRDVAPYSFAVASKGSAPPWEPAPNLYLKMRLANSYRTESEARAVFWEFVYYLETNDWVADMKRSTF